MSFAEYGEPLAFDVIFWRDAVFDPGYEFSGLGRLAVDVSFKLRSLAIMVLLVKADTDRFHHNLIRSGLTREAYLRRCLQEKRLEDHHRASARVAPLLDAIAAGELALARRIVDLSPVEMLDGHEYEDDYCFAQVVHGFLQPTPPEPEMAKLLDRFEAYEPDARLLVLRALLERKADAFADAFAALLDQRGAEIDAAKARCQLEEPEIMAQREVYVDALALLRLAGWRGLPTARDYRYCPSLARAPMRRPMPSE
jgi:hypothetical protein